MVYLVKTKLVSNHLRAVVNSMLLAALHLAPACANAAVEEYGKTF